MKHHSFNNVYPHVNLISISLLFPFSPHSRCPFGTRRRHDCRGTDAPRAHPAQRWWHGSSCSLGTATIVARRAANVLDAQCGATAANALIGQHGGWRLLRQPACSLGARRAVMACLPRATMMVASMGLRCQ